jgi:Flp pilus assembly pilin Flp
MHTTGICASCCGSLPVARSSPRPWSLIAVPCNRRRSRARAGYDGAKRRKGTGTKGDQSHASAEATVQKQFTNTIIQGDCIEIMRGRAANSVGQDLVEYALLITLVALAAVTGINNVASAIGTVFTTSATRCRRSYKVVLRTISKRYQNRYGGIEGQGPIRILLFLRTIVFPHSSKPSFFAMSSFTEMNVGSPVWKT